MSYLQEFNFYAYKYYKQKEIRQCIYDYINMQNTNYIISNDKIKTFLINDFKYRYIYHNLKHLLESRIYL